MDYRIVVSGNTAEVYTPYHPGFAERIKKMHGVWDRAKRCWVVPSRVVDDVRAAMREYYGRDDVDAGDVTDVVLTFGKTLWGPTREPVVLLGKVVATAFGRDSGARLGDDAFVIGGEAPKSGGSVKNYCVVIPEGCVIRLTDVQMGFLGDDLPEGVTAEVSAPREKTTVETRVELSAAEIAILRDAGFNAADAVGAETAIHALIGRLVEREGE